MMSPTQTVWNVSKYGVFSGPYFPAFGLNTDQKKLRIWTLFSQWQRFPWTCVIWIIPKLNTAWKVSKYGFFSGPYFPALGLNTERYFVVSLRIQSECRKIRTRKTPYLDTFHTVKSLYNDVKNSHCILWIILCNRKLFLNETLTLSSIML